MMFHARWVDSDAKAYIDQHAEKGLGESFPEFLDILETALKSQQTISRKI